MKLIGEIFKKEVRGDDVQVTISKVHSEADADWREYHDAICIRVPMCRNKSYEIGRKVILDVRLG